MPIDLDRVLMLLLAPAVIIVAYMAAHWVKRRYEYVDKIREINKSRRRWLGKPEPETRTVSGSLRVTPENMTVTTPE